METEPVEINKNIQDLDLSQVAVIIPALNEESSIGLVLEALPEVGKVIVVDNGSEDKTAEIARSYGADVKEEKERGYGAACLKGIASISYDSQPDQFKIIAFVDADFSDHPDLLPELVRPIIEDKADFVMGSRLLGEREKGAMPPQSVFGNKLACFLMNRMYGSEYTDLGPFRVIRFDKLQSLGMIDQNFGWTVEMQLKAIHKNLKTIEIPVPYRKRIGTSKISGTISGSIKAGYKILSLIAKYGIFKKS
jgi:glycosyltransferase involved in cell wall biosynthesis